MQKKKVCDFIFCAAKEHPADPAIYLSPQKFVDYAQLSAIIKDLSEQLCANNVLRDTRIAIILPNSAAELIMFYAVLNTAVAVPLNHHAAPAELSHYLEITKVSAIITNREIANGIEGIAEAMKLPMLIIDSSTDKLLLQHSNAFRLPKIVGCVKHDTDVAAVFFTSGTTGGNKVVALTHTNLMVPAEVHRKAYKVKHTDRALNVIPLFHIYGITGSVLVAAAGGAGVFCLPDFKAGIFFKILKDLRIDWYAAGSAVQSAVASYAEKINAQADDYALSVIRSGGAALPVGIINSLKRHFHAVVLPGYGMTETSGLGSTSRVDDGEVRDNSAGLVTGVEIKIVDENRNELPAMQSGQIIVRGPSIITGYENKKDSDAFWPDGYFATGDLGYLDEDNYLYITGRINDIINKGGEKISPYEVERTLLTHPDVLEAAVFPIPHESLGQLPIAAVVLADDSYASEASLKSFLSRHLDFVKIPAQILFTKQLPKSSTGKIKRSVMYQYIKDHPKEFWTDSDKTDILAHDEKFQKIEKELTSIWRDILHKDDIGSMENYFTLGGDSLSLAFLFTQIQERLKISLPLESILLNGTIHTMAALIYKNEQLKSGFEFIVPIHLSNSANAPLFCLHALNGDVFTYRKLAQALGDEYTVYGLTFNKDSKKVKQPVDLKQLASVYIKEIRKIQPQGPYYLLGYSIGGALAYEAAGQLREQGQKTAILALLDTRFKFRQQLVEKTFNELREKMLKEIKLYHRTSTQMANEFAIAKMLGYAFANYKLIPYTDKVFYFYADLADPTDAQQSLRRLKELAADVEVIHIKSRHATLIAEPAINDIAEYLKKEMTKLQSAASKRK